MAFNNFETNKSEIEKLGLYFDEFSLNLTKIMLMSDLHLDTNSPLLSFFVTQSERMILVAKEIGEMRHNVNLMKDFLKNPETLKKWPNMTHDERSNYFKDIMNKALGDTYANGMSKINKKINGF